MKTKNIELEDEIKPIQALELSHIYRQQWKVRWICPPHCFSAWDQQKVGDKSRSICAKKKKFLHIKFPIPPNLEWKSLHKKSW